MTKDGKKFRETGDTAQGYVLQTRFETVDEFRARLLETLAAAPDRYYQRAEIPRTEEQTRDGAEATWMTARNIRDAELSKRYPMNADACDQYGSFCPYFGVCAGMFTLSDPALFRDSGEHEELAGAPPGLPVVTTSSLKAFRSCPRKYLYAYVYRRRAIETTAPLRFADFWRPFALICLLVLAGEWWLFARKS